VAPREAGFPKSSRLLRKPDFSRVFDKGFRVQARFATLLLNRNDTGHPRLGIVASRKLGDAVRRNRAKRVIREVFRRTDAHASTPMDLVVIPRREILTAAYSDVEADLTGAMRRGVSRLGGDARN
jgi:ribonuclease P protein component